MKFLNTLLGTGALLAASALPLLADGAPSVALDLGVLPGIAIWGDGGASLSPLAMDAAGAPAVVLVKVPANSPAHQAHATSDGQDRFAIVLSGTLYYADGETVDAAAEQAYGPGSVLLIHSGTKHWVSTRESDLELMLVAVPPAQLAPPIVAQLDM